MNNGRDTTGRFVPGNPGGPGNPRQGLGLRLGRRRIRRLRDRSGRPRLGLGLGNRGLGERVRRRHGRHVSRSSAHDPRLPGLTPRQSPPVTFA